jgi:hypothetical protein
LIDYGIKALFMILYDIKNGDYTAKRYNLLKGQLIKYNKSKLGDKVYKE